MFTSLGAVIDVVIGLIFCYLLLGLIGSSLQEALASFINLRGSKLRDGLQSLLAHGEAPGMNSQWLFSRVFGHSLICPMGDRRAPSYVSAANFSTALIDSLGDGSRAPLFSQVERGVANLPDGPVKQTLAALLVQAQGDLDKFRADVERWFDDSMDRVSGIYKRWAHNFMLTFGVVIAFAANVDTVDIAHTLWGDPAARAQMAAAANQAVAGAQSASDVAGSPAQAIAEAKALPVPIGWSGHERLDLTKVLGCLVTALAVSLGAPFWFDTLQKFLNMRTTGPKPAKSDLSPD